MRSTFCLLVLAAFSKQILAPAYGAPSILGKPIALEQMKPKPGLLDSDLFAPQFEPISQAIKFVPYPYLDPKTGKPISGSAVIALPNGKKITIAQYYGELNQHEEYLAQKGYSLKDDSRDDLGTVQKAISTKSLIKTQMDLVLGSIKATQIKGSELDSIKSQFMASSLNSSAIGNLVIPGGIVKPGVAAMAPGALPPPAKCSSADTVTRSDDWPKRFGNSDWNFRLNAGVKFEATCNRVAGTAEAGTDGAMFGKSFSLAKGKVLAEAVRDKHYKVDLDVLIIGKKVFDYDKSQKNKFEVGDKYSKNIPVEVKAQIPIGPIRLSISGGVRGSAEFQYKFKFDGLSALATVEPKISADAFAEAGLNAYIAEAGAGADLLLASIKLPLSALAEVKPQSGRFVAHGKIFGHLVLKAMDGKVYAYVKVWAPKWNNPFRMKTYRIDITKWEGFLLDKTLFNIQSTKVLVASAS